MTRLVAAVCCLLVPGLGLALERVVIEGTPKTPTISFDSATGVLEIKGRSIPENSIELYAPLLDALERYAARPAAHTRAAFAFDALSPGSREPVAAVLKKLEAINKGGSALTINWYYEEDDEDMLEAGEDYQAIIDVPFKLQALPSSAWDVCPHTLVTVLGPCPGDDSSALVVAALKRGREDGACGYAEYELRSCHERAALVEEVAAGEARIDGFLVVAAGASAIDQALEGGQLAAMLGNVPVVFTLTDSTADPVDVVLQFRAAVPNTHSVFVEAGSAATLACGGGAGAALAGLGATLNQLEHIVRDTTSPLFMPVDDFDDRPAVLGTLQRGTVRAGESVELVGLGAREGGKSVVTGVEMFRRVYESGQAGDEVALVLRGIDKKDIRRGMVIAKPGSIKPHTDFRVDVYVLKKEEGGRHTPFHNKYRPLTFVTGTAEVEAKLVQDASGSTAVRLIAPIAMDKGLRFALREGGRTVGAGQVIEIIK